ncbi:hypothetical protein [Treponema sp. UBA753]|uniref:hypothetical protein n=1 Tax=Treponema sp. UBA753 TaxID=1947747 RepID=UPI000E9B7F35|nr:hypothetical protein [Treponema sp. UBA753]HAZ97259.1 hypothetical protein [Treponema sp.]
MELFVNGEKIDITLEDEKTVGEVLKSFEKEAEKSDATTIGIFLNGKKVLADDFDEASKTPLEENTKIELTVLSKQDVIDSLEKSKDKFSSLAQKLPEVPVALQGGKDKEANTVIAELAEAIDDFCHTAALSALFPEVYSSIVIDGKSVTEFFEEFAPIAADFEQSLETKDSVTSGDLCEYEIAPRLELIAKAIEDGLKK